MKTWADIYKEVSEVVSHEYSGLQFFRGHANSEWPLTPSLGRLGPAAAAKLGYDPLFKLEASLYSRFTTRAGRLLERTDDSWSALFAMQHHGLPTRLLDWSRTFSIALHFALIDPANEAAVWILSPYDLNQEARKSPEVMTASSLGDYSELYFRADAPTEPAVIAITAEAYTSRLSGQHGAFTLHNRLDASLEMLHANCLRKIIIPHTTYGDARQFLHVAGVSEFALFPDLDGLARELRRTFCF